MKTLDLRSESAVKLLAEFLDMDTPYYVGDPEEPSTGRFVNAERFSHGRYHLSFAKLAYTFVWLYIPCLLINYNRTLLVSTFSIQGFGSIRCCGTGV